MQHRCFFCNTIINPLRVEYLEESGLAEHNWTCLEHSQAKRKLGFFQDGRQTDDFEIELGELIICDSFNNTPLVPKEIIEEEDEV